MSPQYFDRRAGGTISNRGIDMTPVERTESHSQFSKVGVCQRKTLQDFIILVKFKHAQSISMERSPREKRFL